MKSKFQIPFIVLNYRAFSFTHGSTYNAGVKFKCPIDPNPWVYPRGTPLALITPSVSFAAYEVEESQQSVVVVARVDGSKTQLAHGVQEENGSTRRRRRRRRRRAWRELGTTGYWPVGTATFPIVPPHACSFPTPLFFPPTTATSRGPRRRKRSSRETRRFER